MSNPFDTDLADIDLTDVLHAVLVAGVHLGIIEALGQKVGRDDLTFMRAVAQTVTFADRLAAVDPAAGGLVRQLAFRVMHGPDDIVIEQKDLTP